jgi:hypothetical protein
LENSNRRNLVTRTKWSGLYITRRLIALTITDLLPEGISASVLVGATNKRSELSREGAGHVRDSLGKSAALLAALWLEMPTRPSKMYVFEDPSFMAVLGFLLPRCVASLLCINRNLNRWLEDIALLEIRLLALHLLQTPCKKGSLSPLLKVGEFQSTAN